MGFCTFCGNQVADGEVCPCQQQAAAPQQGTYTSVPQPEYTQPQTNYASQPAGGSNGGLFTPIVENFKDSLDNPLDAGKNFYQKATMKGALTSIIALVSLYVVTSIFNLLGSALHVLAVAKRAAKPILALTGVKYGEYLKLNDTSRGEILRNSGITGASWVQAVFFPIVYCVLVGALMIGVYYLASTLILKKSKIDIQNIVKFAGAVSLPIGVALVVKFIRGFIHVAGVNNTVMAALSVAALLVALLQAFEILKELIPNKKDYVIVLCILVIGLIISNYLIGGLFLGRFYSRFSPIPFLI